MSFNCIWCTPHSMSLHVSMEKRVNYIHVVLLTNIVGLLQQRGGNVVVKLVMSVN